jgi:hypothetical protein
LNSHVLLMRGLNNAPKLLNQILLVYEIVNIVHTPQHFLKLIVVKHLIFNLLLFNCFLNSILHFIRQYLVLFSNVDLRSSSVRDLLLFNDSITYHFLSFLVPSKEVVVKMTYDFFSITRGLWSLDWFWSFTRVIASVWVYSVLASVTKILCLSLAHLSLCTNFWIVKCLCLVSWIECLFNVDALTRWRENLVARRIWLNFIPYKHWWSILVLFAFGLILLLQFNFIFTDK